MGTKESVVLQQMCVHASQVEVFEVERPARGCETCLATGGQWVHLRHCLICGRVGCCDASPSRHATAHFRETGHPIATSGEAGEGWVWCFADERYLTD